MDSLNDRVEVEAPAATLLIRFSAAVIFISEGLQKFIFPDALGVGRFAKIGIPQPALTAPFVGALEVICGILLLIGLFTRLAAIALFFDMLVAIASTKIPILLGHGYWHFTHSMAPKLGGWAFLHESRTDLAMLCATLFLAIVGPGAWSIDYGRLQRRQLHSVDTSRARQRGARI